MIGTETLVGMEWLWWDEEWPEPSSPLHGIVFWGSHIFYYLCSGKLTSITYYTPNARSLTSYLYLTANVL